MDKILKKNALVYGRRRSGILHKRLELRAKKKVFSENQTKKNHSSHEKLAIWRRVNKLGEKMATGRTDKLRIQKNTETPRIMLSAKSGYIILAQFFFDTKITQ